MRTWERLVNPFGDAKKLRTASGNVFERMDEEGHYWSGRGWESGVHWAQLLQWGPVEEVSRS